MFSMSSRAMKNGDDEGTRAPSQVQTRSVAAERISAEEMRALLIAMAGRALILDDVERSPEDFVDDAEAALTAALAKHNISVRRAES
jgi:hypothetical protein